MVTIYTTCCSIKELSILSTLCIVFRIILKSKIVISLYVIARLILIMGTDCVFCDVGADVLCII
jgi:hypothetical protein